MDDRAQGSNGDRPAIPDVERPRAASTVSMKWGSDAIAELLRRLDLPFVALVPGSSYRGLHDSLVNYLGNAHPQLLVCLHEEHAVALAHGYAKVTEKPIAAALHSNVGLMHAAMAIYNAWCDRAPVLLLGATGPVDAARRRPWIDWIHTSRDQASIVRDYVKWDAQPASIPAALDALLRADRRARQQPRGPVYVCFDVSDQEAELTASPVIPDPARYQVPPDPAPPEEAVAEAVRLLGGATRPVILAGRVSRSTEDWNLRIRLAEALGAAVVTDLKLAAAFPTNHPLHCGAPAMFLTDEQKRTIAQADVILGLDWVDLAGTLGEAFGDRQVSAKVINVSIDDQLTNGWSYDHFGLPPADVAIPAPPDSVTAILVDALGAPVKPAVAVSDSKVATSPVTGPIDMGSLARALRRSFSGRDISLLRVPLSWPCQETPFAHPLDYIGYDGGAGVGSGPGMAVGAALALKGSGRMPVAILGDGDFLMGANALWTAAHYGIPLFVIVANNKSYYNDEVHQEKIAVSRDRPIENKWIGQRLTEPAVDIAELSRSLGISAAPEVTEISQLRSALQQGHSAVQGGDCYVLSVEIVSG